MLEHKPEEIKKPIQKKKKKQTKKGNKKKPKKVAASPHKIRIEGNKKFITIRK